MEILNLKEFMTAQISERERVMRKRERKRLDKINFKNMLTPPRRTSYKSTE